MFTTTRKDGRSFRDVAVDAIKAQPPESIVTYKVLAQEMDLTHPQDLQKIQAAVRSANNVLLKMYSRGVKNVPNVGYRIVPAREHAMIANDHHVKADKSVGRMVSWFDGANLDEMTSGDRKMHEGLSIIAHGLAAMHSYNRKRFDRLEELFKGPVVDQK